MYRLLPLLFLLFAGCQRPVAAVLTYAPVPAAAEDDGTVDMNQVLTVVQRRLRTTRLPCRASLDDSQQIRVETSDDSQEMLGRIDGVVLASGTFELRIAANSTDHADLIQRAQETDARELHNQEGELLAWWVPLKADADSNMLVLSDLTTREIIHEDAPEVELLVVNDPYQVDGSLLKRASPSIDQTGRPNVTFVLTDKGGKLMAGLTADNLPDPVSGFARKLAIIFNGRVFSAPAIQSMIGARGEITGDFTDQEVQDLVNVLNSGSLPIPLKRVNIEHVVAEQ